MNKSISEHVAAIVNQYQRITAMPEIIISEVTMKEFHCFLELLSNDHGSQFSEGVLAHPDIRKIKLGIQGVFSHASSIYERHWAAQIVNSDYPQQLLKHEYPYYQHYERATALEFSAIEALASGAVNRVLMVGSGALPLTSIMLSEKGVATNNLDIHKEDLALGQAVSEKLNPNTSMMFINNDICREPELDKYDVIWLAALVGDEKNKATILAHLYENMRPGGQLVVRTSYNLRTLLYPSVSEEDLAPFKLKLKIQTYSDNFHSIIIAQKPIL